MRRTLLLGSVTPILALALLGFAQTVLHAQTPKSETPKLVSPPATFGDQPFAVAPEPGQPESRTPVVNAPALSGSSMQQRFIELSKKKALALTEEQLKHEVERMEAEVRELEAWVKTQEAVRVLHDVVEKHPNTKAAETANAAIQLIEERRVSPNFTREAPRPDSNFRRAAPASDPGPVPVPGPVFDRDARSSQTSGPRLSPTS